MPVEKQHYCVFVCRQVSVRVCVSFPSPAGQPASQPASLPIVWCCVCVFVFYDLPLQSQVSEVLAASNGGDNSWPFDMEDR